MMKNSFIGSRCKTTPLDERVLENNGFPCIDREFWQWQNSATTILGQKAKSNG